MRELRPLELSQRLFRCLAYYVWCGVQAPGEGWLCHKGQYALLDCCLHSESCSGYAVICNPNREA